MTISYVRDRAYRVDRDAVDDCSFRVADHHTSGVLVALPNHYNQHQHAWNIQQHDPCWHRLQMPSRQARAALHARCHPP